MLRLTCVRARLLQLARHFDGSLKPRNRSHYCIHRRSLATTSAADGAKSRLTPAEQLALIESVDQLHIRNFSIIAHIDHGKSTLADRLLEFSGNIAPLHKSEQQVLDSLQVERERGITVKAQTVSLFHKHTDGAHYLINLIDTPGHVDFSYEVSRSLAACNGALLLIDSSQGLQAQTLANYHLANNKGLDILFGLSKIDLPHSDIPGVSEQLRTAFKCSESDIMKCSAKNGIGIEQVLSAVVDYVSPPSGSPTGPLRALLFDSWYDMHRGVICLILVVDGQLTVGDHIAAYHSQHQYVVEDLGLKLSPTHSRSVTTLRTGQVGYMIAGVKSSRDLALGETFYFLANSKHRGLVAQSTWQITKDTINPLPGFQPAKSMVFAGLFPSSDSDFDLLTAAIEKLTLNDASVTVSKESSVALGLGYRCGFLGVLHMDVFSTRLEQEFQTSVIITAPTVPYHVYMKDTPEPIRIDSPSKFPLPTEMYNVLHFTQSYVRAIIISPPEYMGELMELCGNHYGLLIECIHLSNTRLQLIYELPLNEIVFDFYDQIKSVTSGYATFDYEIIQEERIADLIKLDIKLNGESIDALSIIITRNKAEFIGRKIVNKLKETIERTNFEIIIQAAVGSTILVRERIAPYRKDVLTKSGKTVGGGDISRKKKLLEKQKAGKKRMKMVGSVELNESIFAEVMKIG